MREKPASDVAGFVLAGGRSSRMGSNKALLEIAGLPLVVRAVRTLEPLAQPVRVVGSLGEPLPPGLSFLPDEFPGAGPLGAISTALRHAEKSWSVIIACDLPYLSRDWLEFLIGRARKSSADVVVPESDYTGAALPEPLCSVLHQSAAEHVRATIERGVRKVMDGFAGLKIERISPADSRAFDRDGMLFQNLNTMKDYEAARARLERKGRD